MPTAFIGATMVEAQFGPAWVKILRPKFWGPGARLVRVGWDPDWRV